MNQLAEADFILVIASPAYKRRADGQESPDKGRGAQFEAAILRNNVMRNLPEDTKRILPVVLPGRSIDEIPTFLNAHSTTRYTVTEFTIEGVESLRYAFAGHPKFALPPLGKYEPPPSRAPGPAAPGTAASGRARLLTSFLTPARCGSDVRFGSASIDGTHYGDSVIIRPSLYVTERKAVRLAAYRADTVQGALIAGVFATGGRSVGLPELAWGNPTLLD